MARTKQQTASKARAAARQKVADHEASDEEREVVLVKWYNSTGEYTFEADRRGLLDPRILKAEGRFVEQFRKRQIVKTDVEDKGPLYDRKAARGGLRPARSALHKYARRVLQQYGLKPEQRATSMHNVDVAKNAEQALRGHDYFGQLEVLDAEWWDPDQWEDEEGGVGSPSNSSSRAQSSQRGTPTELSRETRNHSASNSFGRHGAKSKS